MLEIVAWYLEVLEGPKIRRGKVTTNRLSISASVLFYVSAKSGGHGPSGPHPYGASGIFVGFSF